MFILCIMNTRIADNIISTNKKFKYINTYDT